MIASPAFNTQTRQVVPRNSNIVSSKVTGQKGAEVLNVAPPPGAEVQPQQLGIRHYPGIELAPKSMPETMPRPAVGREGAEPHAEIEIINFLNNLIPFIEKYKDPIKNGMTILSKLYDVYNSVQQTREMDQMVKEYRSKCDPDTVSRMVASGLQRPTMSDADFDQLTRQLFNYKGADSYVVKSGFAKIEMPFQYADVAERLTHQAHLNSWPTSVPFANAAQGARAEGWLELSHAPMEGRLMLKLMHQVLHDQVDTQRLFGLSKHETLKRMDQSLVNFVHRFFSALTTYPNNNMWPIVTAAMIGKAELENLKKLNPGQELAFTAGFPGHSITIRYKCMGKDAEGHQMFDRWVHNRGGASKAFHQFNARGDVAPFVTRGIKLEDARSERLMLHDLANISMLRMDMGAMLQIYLGIHFNVSLMYENSPIVYYTNQQNPLATNTRQNQGKIPAHTDMQWEIPQLVGNCVKANWDSAMKETLGNQHLYNYVKNFMKSEVNRELPLAQEIKDRKDLETDVLLLKHIHGFYTHKNMKKAYLVRYLENLFPFIKPMVNSVYPDGKPTPESREAAVSGLVRFLDRKFLPVADDFTQRFLVEPKGTETERLVHYLNTQFRPVQPSGGFEKQLNPKVQTWLMNAPETISMLDDIARHNPQIKPAWDSVRPDLIAVLQKAKPLPNNGVIRPDA